MPRLTGPRHAKQMRILLGMPTLKEISAAEKEWLHRHDFELNQAVETRDRIIKEFREYLKCSEHELFAKVVGKEDWQESHDDGVRAYEARRLILAEEGLVVRTCNVKSRSRRNHFTP